MKIKLRVNAVDSHIHFTVFCNGNAGNLCLRLEEYSTLVSILEAGVETSRTGNLHEVELVPLTFSGDPK